MKYVEIMGISGIKDGKIDTDYLVVEVSNGAEKVLSRCETVDQAIEYVKENGLTEYLN